MFGARKKKSKSIGNWHGRAMLIDLKKTRITILGRDHNSVENKFDVDRRFKTNFPGTQESKVDTAAENMEVICEIFGTEVSFELVEN